MADEYEVQVIPRMVSVYVSDPQDRARTLASAQVFIYGPRGYMFSIIGEEFLINMPGIIEQIKSHGVRSLEGPMVLPVARAVRAGLRDIAKVTIDDVPEDFGNGIDTYYTLVKFNK